MSRRGGSGDILMVKPFHRPELLLILQRKLGFQSVQHSRECRLPAIGVPVLTRSKSG